jgi:large subunit ribosomal protein L5
MSPRLKTLYKEKAVPNLEEKFNYSNFHQIPKIEKIQLNRGLGLAAQNKNIFKEKY